MICAKPREAAMKLVWTLFAVAFLSDAARTKRMIVRG